jgi:hypothetical protein
MKDFIELKAMGTETESKVVAIVHKPDGTQTRHVACITQKSEHYLFTFYPN